MTKSLKDRADEATRKVQQILGVTVEEHPKEIADAIEQTIINALLAERERCASVAYEECCEEDQDRAHRVAGEIRRIRTALIANLSSMR